MTFRPIFRGSALAALGCAIAASSPAFGQTLFSTDFESDSLGTVPAGWSYADFSGGNNPGPVVAANPNSDGVDSSSQVVHVTGPGGDTALFTDALNLAPVVSSNGIATLSFDYYATNTTSSGLIIGVANLSANVSDPGGYEYDGGGTFYILAPNEADFIGEDDATLPTAGGWQQVNVTLTGNILNDFVTNGDGDLSSARIFLEQWTAHGTLGDVYIDNVSVTAVPEPSATGMGCAIGALAVAGVALKRRRTVSQA
jgi:hypothetical protein